MTPERIAELKAAAERLLKNMVGDASMIVSATTILALLSEREKLLKVVAEAKETFCTQGNAKLHAALTKLERNET